MTPERAAAAHHRLGTGIVWARVEDGFHVGSRAGDFVGYIDRQPSGGYLAYDDRSRCVGSFDELTAAMRALDGPFLAASAPDASEDRPPIELREVR